MLNRLGEVFASFPKHKVKYLVIGGIATVLHGVPRATFDLDIRVRANRVAWLSGQETPTSSTESLTPYSAQSLFGLNEDHPPKF